MSLTVPSSSLLMMYSPVASFRYQEGPVMTIAGVLTGSRGSVARSMSWMSVFPEVPIIEPVVPSVMRNVPTRVPSPLVTTKSG